MSHSLRGDFLGVETHRVEDVLGRDAAAYVRLHQYPGKPKLIPKICEPFDNRLRAAVSQPVTQQFLIGDVPRRSALSECLSAESLMA